MLRNKDRIETLSQTAKNTSLRLNDQSPTGQPQNEASGHLVDRRSFLAGVAGTAMLAHGGSASAFAQASASRVNLAKIATPSSLVTTSENRISAVNDGQTPSNSRDRSNSLYALRKESADEAAPWIDYQWSAPVAIDSIDIYWAIDTPRAKGLPGTEWATLVAPETYQILYWNGSDYVPVENAKGLGTAATNSIRPASTRLRPTGCGYRSILRSRSRQACWNGAYSTPDRCP